MFDLFGNSAKIRNLDTQMREVSRWSSDSALYQTPRMDFFPAKLTAYDSGTGYYSWTEQFYDTTGTRIDKPDAKTGTHTYMPAKLLNGAVITTFPFQVWLMRTIVSDTLGTIYEAVAALPFEEIDLIDKICVTKDGDGFVTDINIQRRTYLVAAYLASEVGTCTTSDEDCCEFVAACGSCGEVDVLPRTMTLVLVSDDSPPPYDTYTFTITWDESQTAWVGVVPCDGYDLANGYLTAKLFCHSSGFLLSLYCSNAISGLNLLGSVVSSSFDCDPVLITGHTTYNPVICNLLCMVGTGGSWTITE